MLLTLAFLADLFEELKDPFDLSAIGYRQLYGWVPPRYRKRNLCTTVYRNLKTGMIEKVIKNGQPCFKLTGRGVTRLTHSFPLLKWPDRRWDGFWRVVVFDIEEKRRYRRDFLRRRLKSLGFGMLQKSVFISPFDLAAIVKGFLKTMGLESATMVLKASNLFVENEKVLAARIWSLPKTNEAYRHLLEFIEAGRSLDGERRDHFLRLVRNRYLDILLEDPRLPYELLPKNWLGEKVGEAVRSLSAI